MVALAATRWGKMDCIYYTADEKLGALEERVDELQAERSAGLVTRLWQTISGKWRRTHRNQIADINMPITPNDSTKRTNSTGCLTTLVGSYKQGKMVTEHVPSQVNNLQMSNSYVVNNGTLNDCCPIW